MTAITVSLLDAAGAEDVGLVERLSGLINNVYATSENGLWRLSATRTTPEEVADFIEAGELVVAEVDGQLAGAVRVRAISDTTGEFGLLAADPEQRGIGVGRGLIDFAESHSRDRGLKTMQLELLVPRAWRHPSKEFLDRWYRRIGYRAIRTTSVDALQPELAPLLATPCDFVVYEKPLDGERPEQDSNLRPTP